jgi:hypothetical protein
MYFFLGRIEKPSTSKKGIGIIKVHSLAKTCKEVENKQPCRTKPAPSIHPQKA